MPTNVTAEFLEAKKEYQEASTTSEKVEATEKMLATVPKHKGTEKLRARLKRRLSKLREKIQEQGGGSGTGFNIPKEGVAQVALVGIPNAGKSSVLNTLTNADADINNYTFTTVKLEPGMMEHNGIKIQLVEIPGLIEDASLGKGMGNKLISAVRVADLLAFIVDLSNDPINQMNTLLKELERSGIRLNDKPPEIELERRSQGGIEIKGENKIRGNIKQVKEMLRDSGVVNGVLIVKEEIGLEEVAEKLDESIVYKKGMILANKGDLQKTKEKYEKLEKKFSNYEIVQISTEEEENLKKAKEKIFTTLNLITIRTKKPGQDPEWPPIAMKKGSKVIQAAKEVHKDMEEKFKYAKVWGDSVDFDGQRVGRSHKIKDGDIVEFHTK